MSKKNKYSDEKLKQKERKKSAFKKFKDKYKLGSHHKMERFGVVSLCFALVFIFILGGSIHSYNVRTKVDIGNIANYNKTFSSSLTDSSGDVVGVYRNKDKTKAYVLFKYTDPKAQSLDVKDYKVFLSAKQEHLKYTPQGSLQMFGSTGYFGVELISNKGIENQILDITIRLGSNLVDITDDVSISDDMDKSFVDNDQFRVYVNPGAKKAQYAPILDKSDATPSDIYKGLTAKIEESDTKESIQTNINSLNTAKNRIDEDRRKLEELGVKVPALPTYVGDDKFVVIKDKNGSDTKNYQMITASIFPGGYDFDWKDVTLSSGSYINQFLPKDKDIYDVVAENDLKASDTSVTSNLSDIVWTWKTDGKPIDLASDMPKNSQVNTIVEDYASACSTYEQIKITLQTSDLRTLVLLEMGANEVDSQFKANTDENNIIVWNQK